MLAAFFSGFFVALSFAVPPGPVAMETMRRGLRGGFFPALRVQLGSIIGDLTWLFLAALGLAPLLQFPWIRTPILVAGIGVLAYLGISAIREACISNPEAPNPSSSSVSGAFRSGIAISLGNPMAVGYWFSVGGAMATAGIISSELSLTVVFAAGFLAAVLIWAVVMAGLAGAGKGKIGGSVFRILTAACGIILLYFGAALAASLPALQTFP